MTYTIESEPDGLVVRLSGHISSDEILAANIEGWEHPERDSHRYQLWDLRAVLSVQVEVGDPYILAAMDNAAFGRNAMNKTAVVLTDPAIAALFDEYLATLDVKAMEAQAFENETAARGWLGAPCRSSATCQESSRPFGPARN